MPFFSFSSLSADQTRPADASGNCIRSRIPTLSTSFRLPTNAFFFCVCLCAYACFYVLSPPSPPLHSVFSAHLLSLPLIVVFSYFLPPFFFSFSLPPPIASHLFISFSMIRLSLLFFLLSLIFSYSSFSILFIIITASYHAVLLFLINFLSFSPFFCPPYPLLSNFCIPPSVP